MKSKLVSVFLCIFLTSFLHVRSQNVISNPTLKTVNSQTLSPPVATTVLPIVKPTTAPQLQIKCLNDDCNKGPATNVEITPSKVGGLISSNMMSDPKPVSVDSEDVTSVPRKGVDMVESGPTVPRKGVTTVHHTQSAKKELKELNATPSTTTTTTTTMTTTTSVPTTDPDESNINRIKSHNLNMLLPTTTIAPREASPHAKPDVTLDEQDFAGTKTSSDDQKSPIGTSLVVGLVCALVLMTVLLFVGLKRIESIRRRREYRRMNDFLIDGMYNDL